MFFFLQIISFNLVRIYKRATNVHFLLPYVMKWKLFSENSIRNMSNIFPSLTMSASYNFPTAAKVSDTLTWNYSLMIRVYFLGIQSVRNKLQIFFNNVQNTNTCTLCLTLYYSNVLISLNYIKIHWYSHTFRSQKTIFREYDCTLLSSWII